MKSFLVLLGGLLFGCGLALSGLTDPARVIGFLDVAGDWDPTLMFVMAGAVASYAAFTALFRRIRGERGWCGSRLPSAGAPNISARLIVGALIFGVGWGLGGFCPGPALAGLGGFRIEALLFVSLMAVGMVLAQRLFHADASTSSSGGACE